MSSHENDKTPDAHDLLGTLRIAKTQPRAVGGTWVTGTVGGHAFEALVFEGHAADPGYELGDSRISKLFLRDQATGRAAACFDRGWDLEPATDAAREIVEPSASRDGRLGD